MTSSETFIFEISYFYDFIISGVLDLIIVS